MYVRPHRPVTQALMTLNFSSIVADALLWHQGISNHSKSVIMIFPWEGIFQYVSIDMVDLIIFFFLYTADKTYEIWMTILGIRSAC